MRSGRNVGEIQEINWIDVEKIFNGAVNYIIPEDGRSWREYNSAENLTAIFSPLAKKFSGVELELEKNKLKYALPIKLDDGRSIEIADCVVREILDHGKGIRDYCEAL